MEVPGTLIQTNDHSADPNGQVYLVKQSWTELVAKWQGRAGGKSASDAGVQSKFRFSVMPPTAEAFLLRDADCVPGLFIEADAPVSASQDWIVPLALLEGMMAGKTLRITGAISSRLQNTLETIQNIYCCWLPGAQKIAVSAMAGSAENSARGGSVFFSGGVDGYYSLLRHREAIDNLILVHGYDISLGDTGAFERAKAAAQEAAALFEKRLITVRTNVRSLPQACGWEIRHGAALAAIAHALQPNHSTVYVGASYSYRDLHIWGSHSLLDPLWSSLAVEIVHDGAETNRVGKLRFLCQYPEMLKLLRVCLQNTKLYNCGQCEKCLRTMIGLLGLDCLQYARFPPVVDAAAVRRIRLNNESAPYWRELLTLDLPTRVRSAVEHVLRNHAWGLPPHGSARDEVLRLYCAAGRVGRLLQALLS